MAVDAIQDAISPGSTPYGERGALEGAISDAGAAGGGLAAAATPGGSTVPPIGLDGSDPLGALLGGEVPINDAPVTDGLSVGPGATPFADQSPDPLHDRLLALATEAESPRLRAQARALLRQHVRAKRR